MEIRKLKSDDWEQWNVVRTEALDAAPFAFGRSNEDELPTRKGKFESNINRDDRFIIGAFDQGEMIGISGFFRHEPIKTFHKATVWSVFVKPKFQQRGLGRKIMEETLRLAWQMNGLEIILIGVSSDSLAAFQLYRSLGFAEYGREPKSLKYNGSYSDEILMSKHRE